MNSRKFRGPYGYYLTGAVLCSIFIDEYDFSTEYSNHNLMKKRVAILGSLLCTALLGFAQVPQKFNYQAVVRNSDNQVVSEQAVGFRMTVLKGGPEGEAVYSEIHQTVTSPLGIADLMIGGGQPVSGAFGKIRWGDDPYFLAVELDPSGGDAYEPMGVSQLISVPYALYTGNVASPTRKFTIQEESGHPVDSALFEVKNAEGQTVFAVYPEGTRVYILDEQSKGIKGGFAVGGYRRSVKGVTNEFMRITPDSIRIYVDEEPAKGIKGGFAVGGYNRSVKGISSQYFSVEPDHARFTLVSDQPDETRSGALTVSTLPRTGGPLTGDGPGLLNLSRANTFIGHLAGEAHMIGTGNIYIGTRAGANNPEGNGNIFIGHEAGMNEQGSGKLYIDNFGNDPELALIYGDFANKSLRINNQLGIGKMAIDFALEVNGDVAKSEAGDWNAVSDARIKTGIMGIEDACGQIMQLHPVKFRYTDEWRALNPSVSDREYYNFVAQEFREVFPHAVKRTGGSPGNGGDDLLMMDSYPAQVVAIKAIQELIEENRRQQEIIEQLQQRVEKLESRESP